MGRQTWPALMVLSIGAEIRARRLRLSLSLGRFAQRVEVSEEDAEAIERGEYELDVVLLFHVASALKIPTSRILSGAEERVRKHSKVRKIKRSPNRKGARGRRVSR